MTGALPALLLEQVMAARLGKSPAACLDAADELTGAAVRACGRREAGRRILACWGRARVEP